MSGGCENGNSPSDRPALPDSFLAPRRPTCLLPATFNSWSLLSSALGSVNKINVEIKICLDEKFYCVSQPTHLCN